MSDFYTVLRRSLDRADSPGDEQRQEIYDRLRAVIVRKLDAHRPRLKDTEFRSRLVAFDGAVARIEDEIAASFAAADDVFEELPYEEAPAALPEELGGEEEFADEILELAEEEAPAVVDPLAYDDEDAYAPGEAGEAEASAEYQPEEEAPVGYGFAAEEEIAEDDTSYHDGPEGKSDLDPVEEYEVGEPASYEAPEYDAQYEPQGQPPDEVTGWTTGDAAVPEIDAPEAGGPSSMWGSAIDLAWDETTAQWHDPDEPVRPPPASEPPPERHARPDSEWDRRLQMALVEETVRSRGSAAAPEWIAAEDEVETEDTAFFDEGQWDPGTTSDYDTDELPPEPAGRGSGGVASRLRSLAPGRLLRRGRADRGSKAAAVRESRPLPPSEDRIEPPLDIPEPAAPARQAKERRTSLRSVTIDDSAADYLLDRPRQGPGAPKARGPANRESPSQRAIGDVVDPREAVRTADSQVVRPVRRNEAPTPSREDERPPRAPARPTRPRPADEPSKARGLDTPRAPLRIARQDANEGDTIVRARSGSPDASPGKPRSLAPAANRAVRYLGADGDEGTEPSDEAETGFDVAARRAAPRELPPPRDLPPQRRARARTEPSRNAPPEGRRVMPERRYGGNLLRIGVISAIVVVLATAAVLIVPGLLSDDGGAVDPVADAGIVLFGGADPLVFQTGPNNPANFDGETAGGLVRVTSSASGAARATVGPGIADRVDGKEVRVLFDVRGTPGRAATTLRIAYLRGNALLDWRTVTVTGEFAIADAVWTIPTGIPSTGDALLISPGVPGDGTAVDIRRIVMEIGG